MTGVRDRPPSSAAEGRRYRPGGSPGPGSTFGGSSRPPTLAGGTDANTERPSWRGRRGAIVLVLVAVGASLNNIGVSGISSNGWPSFREFWTEAFSPRLDRGFVEITIEATGLTVGYAVLGTVFSLLIGFFVSPYLSSQVWADETSARRRGLRRGLLFLGRLAWVVPRSIHEAVIAVILVRVLGFDPMVAVLAIGVPFGAVTAKVFAETIDEADQRPYRQLRSGGATRATALFYGTFPRIWPDLTSYGFYRFECALRSSAILGVIGAGGLGQELALSFTSLHYDEVWTLLGALIIVNFFVDLWSAFLRRRSGRRAVTTSLIGLVVLAALSWRWTGISLSSLWSERTRRLAGEVFSEVTRPSVGPDGFGALFEAAVETVAMAVVAGTLAAIVAAPLAFAAARRPNSRAGERAGRWNVVGDVRRMIIRIVLLVTRAIPPPIWAFLFVLILRPGALTGAVALAVYNVGVLGRLYSEVVEDRDRGPEEQLAASGAAPAAVAMYATVPAVAPRFVALALYRWEVILRETVVVGLVGAGGLGRLVQEHLVARDLQAVAGTALALAGLAMAAEWIGGGLRKTLR